MRIHRRDAETQSQEEERVNREPHEIYEPRERRQNGRWLWTKWTEPESKASAECTRWRVRSHSHRRFGFWSVRLYANLFAYMRTFWRILEKNIFFPALWPSITGTQWVGDVSEMEWRSIGELGNGSRQKWVEGEPPGRGGFSRGTKPD